MKKTTIFVICSIVCLVVSVVGLTMTHGQDDQPTTFTKTLSGWVTFSPDGKRFVYLVPQCTGQISLNDCTSRVLVDDTGKKTKSYSGFRGLESIFFTQDSQTLVFGAMKGSGWVIVIDGKESILYPNGDSHPKFVSIANANSIAYTISSGKTELFVGPYGTQTYDRIRYVTHAKNGQHYAFVGRRGNKDIVITDGVEIGTYDAYAILPITVGKVSFMGSTFLFSPDGNSMAYIIKEGDKQTLIKDGQKLGTFDYIAVNDEVMDAQDQSARYSTDSQNFAFRVYDKARHKALLFLDGKEIGAYDTIYDFLFAPDSQGYSVLVGGAGGMELIKDAKVLATGDKIDYVVYKPNSHDISYSVRKGRKDGTLTGKQLIMTNNSIVADSDISQNQRYRLRYLQYSPDGRYFSFLDIGENFEDGHNLVIDGKETQVYKSVDNNFPFGPVIYSPDSTSYFFIATSGDRRNIVTNHGVVGVYDEFETYSFGSGVLVINGVLNKKLFTTIQTIDENLIQRLTDANLVLSSLEQGKFEQEGQRQTGKGKIVVEEVKSTPVVEYTFDLTNPSDVIRKYYHLIQEKKFDEAFAMTYQSTETLQQITKIYKNASNLVVRNIRDTEKGKIFAVEYLENDILQHYLVTATIVGQKLQILTIKKLLESTVYIDKATTISIRKGHRLSCSGDDSLGINDVGYPRGYQDSFIISQGDKEVIILPFYMQWNKDAKKCFTISRFVGFGSISPNKRYITYNTRSFETSNANVIDIKQKKEVFPTGISNGSLLWTKDNRLVVGKFNIMAGECGLWISVKNNIKKLVLLSKKCIADMKINGNIITTKEINEGDSVTKIVKYNISKK